MPKMHTLCLTILLSLSSLALAGTDGDGVADAIDNCPSVANADQLDTDSDGVGNECDTDDDNDGYSDDEERTASTNPLLASSSPSWSNNGATYTLQMDRLPSQQGWIYQGTDSIQEGDVARLENGFLRWDTLGAESLIGSDVSGNYRFLTEEYDEFALEL